ncbi:VCBS repeat-containing protein [Streptomyces lancefieldiae]|uniref:FG-GAP and VCBS repeat-containing protein n=1 Tax=Streptomyces lancefieldiae TaxID=3075520 RepID=A0ABU3AW02_9ACTN|nr:FG-GAP and VCBS repeat-containing protein [Streptomyces sp. DSM 40712]MDT0613757.1 FG-GAP and VCBS repeat-containing protein [Streptomyces sp. DSM 40712]
MIVRMDGSGDQVAGPRRRVGKRAWAIGGGAAVVALAVVVGAVVADDEPSDITASHACRTSVHGGAPATRPGPDRSAPPGTAPAADFDGDGHPDLAFGSLGSVKNGSGGGSIEVAYGSGDGTGLDRCQYLTQDDPAIPGKNRDEAFFGTDVVARDFDEDGYTDLATAVFDWKPSLIIMWGSPGGLSRATRVPGTDGSHVSWDIDPILEEQLAAGDFDGDGHADLVFGLGSDEGLLKGPFERNGTPAATGAVPAPRRPEKDIETANYQDLVAGDLNGDGADELVTFHYDAPLDASWSQTRWPVGYFQGGPDGLTQPDGVDLPDASTAAVGDVDGDGYGDLVLSPRGGDASRSSVTVVYGSETGPGKRTTTVDRDTPGVPGEEPQDEDAVLVSLDTGDVNGDGYADVVAGAPRWDPYAKPGPEQVLFLAGGPDGLTGEGARVFEAGDLDAGSGGRAGFGASVGLTDLGGDRRADLVVAAPGSDTVDGSAWLLPGTADGPSTGGVTRLYGDTFDDTEGLGLLLGGGGIAR